MSIVRLSLRGPRVAAPKANGDFVAAPFDAARGTGIIGTFDRPKDGGGPAALKRARAALDPYLGPAIKAAAARLTADQPVCLMVHGFLFDPEKAVMPAPKDNDNPHGRVFHFVNGDEHDETKEHSAGWPVQLGFKQSDRGANGLAIAVGWYSHPGFATSLLEGYKNFYSRAYQYAEDSCWPLVAILDAVAAALPERQIDIFCHSLGSTLVLRALYYASKWRLPVVKRLGRTIILGGSEYTQEARLMYRELRAHVGAGNGLGPHFFNIVSRENLVLDLLAENFGPRSWFTSTQVIGHNGLESGANEARWIDIQIDSQAVATWLRNNHGLTVAGDDPGSPWDHWYYYTFRGNMAFYNRILRDRSAFSIAGLRAPGSPGGSPFPEGVAVGAFARRNP